MNEKMPNSNNKAPQNAGDSLLVYLKEDFFPHHGTKIIIALVLVVAAIFAIAQNLANKKEKEIAMAEELGKGLDYIYSDKQDSALITLESSMQNNNLEGLALAKASLLVANIHLQNNNLDTAQIMYKQALSNAGSAELIASAAESGLAVVAMEKQNYTEAITLLNGFINKYGKRTGNLEDRYKKAEPTDKIPTVPDMMWKLALCYLETGDKENTKQTLEKILKIYGDSQKAADASKLLATLTEK